MKSIEVKNVSAFEPDVGEGKLLARGKTAKVEDNETNRALIEDGHLLVIEKSPKPPRASGTTTPDGENGEAK